MTIPVPPTISAGIMLSYRCNAACRHCMYGCTPRWRGGWMDPEDLAVVLDQLVIRPAPGGPSGIDLNLGLHFSGGEPFLNFPLLLQGVRMAAERFIPSLFVETNCVWARDDATARTRLEALADAGLNGMMVSVNPFYLEYVPFERTERAIRLGAEIFGSNLIVYQWEYYRRFREMGIEGCLSLEEYARRSGLDDLTYGVELFLSGRACAEVAPLGHFVRYAAEALCVEPCRPAFLRSWHNHIDNECHLIPGYCGGLSLGDARDMAAIRTGGIDPEAKPVLAMIAAGEFRSLLTFAERRGYEQDPGGYYSKCHLCLEVRRHLAQTGEFVELTPAEFYRHTA